MTASPGTAAISIAPVGPLAGTAWLAPAPAGVELHVIGKIVLQLGQGGTMTIVNKPEVPGWNQGRAAREEIDVTPSRRLVVRGHRRAAGKVVLRRGTTPLAEIAFGPGVETASIDLPNTMQTTIAGRRGDDWLVVEGVEGPQARRWCKLPKLGIVATWDEIERLLLTSKLCMVDVSSWTIAFVMRGSRKLPAAMAPGSLTMSVLDLAQGMGETREPPRAASGSGTFPTAKAPPSGPNDTQPLKRPNLPKLKSGASVLSSEDGPTMISKGMEPKKPEPAGAPPSSSAGRLGRTRQVEPEEMQRLLAGAKRPLEESDEDPTKLLPNQKLLELQRELRPNAPTPPSSHGEVSRAFAALALPALPAAAALRREIEDRVRSGSSLEGLDLTRTDLQGADLRGGALAGLDFSESDLRKANLIGADLSNTKLDGAKLDDAKLDRVNLTGATLEFASMRRASLCGANITNATFAGADLRDADLRSAKPQDALMGAELAGARRS